MASHFPSESRSRIGWSSCYGEAERRQPGSLEYRAKRLLALARAGKGG
jgi:hypothetical protein